MARKPKNLTYQRMIEMLTDFFGDRDKALVFWMHKNPNLGGMSPYEMMKAGRGEKLAKFISASIAENYR